MRGSKFAQLIIFIFGFMTCSVQAETTDALSEDALYMERYGYWSGKLGSGKMRLLISNSIEAGVARISWLGYENNLSKAMKEVCAWEVKLPNYEGRKIRTKDERSNSMWTVEIDAGGSVDATAISCSTKINSSKDCVCTKH